MTGRWSKNKTKKPLDTSLGQAPKETDKVTDLSHLQKPIITSIFGLKQVLALLQTATVEVQDYITNECDVLYECRVCRTIFRSFANFILHKRNYCKEKYNHLGGSSPEAQESFIVEANSITIEEKGTEKNGNDKVVKECSEETIKKNETKKAILPIIDKLVKKQEINILAKNILNEDLSNKTDHSDDDVVFVSEASSVVLEQIDTSSAAVFQTAVKNLQVSESNSGLMKSEVMEIHGIFDNNQAVLGANGRICDFETNKISKTNILKPDLICTECKFTFSTEKTLTHHIKYKHNKTCIVYPCPECKETFATAWSVYRHLYKVHRKTSSQVRRMRSQIHSGGIRKDQEPEKKKSRIQVELKENEEWMTNFEGDKDLQMCVGCGKRFERKAALHSHSQMCTKRIAVCNTIKENNLKAKCTENKNKLIEKMNKINEVKMLKGSAKRKPNLMFVQKVPSNIISVNKEENRSEENRNDKDTVEHSDQTQNKTVNSTEVGAQEYKSNVDGESRKIDHVNIIENCLRQTDSEAVSEVISDSDDEKENSLTISSDKQIIKNSDGEVTITKYKDATMGFSKPKNILPEIEIFTISDDSCDSEATEKNNVKTATRLQKPETSKTPDSLLKRKRRTSLHIGDEITLLANECKEYLNDDLDKCFLTRVRPYIDKNELRCIPCQTTYLSHNRLLRHMSSHFSWFRFQCSKCSFMSFNKYDCTNHAYVQHSISNNLMDSTVLPIPKWKVLLTAHNFSQLTEGATNKNITEFASAETNIDCNNKSIDANNKTMPLLEAVQETSKKLHLEETNIKVDVPSETVVLEDDEMPDICHDNSQVVNTLVLSDEELREHFRNSKSIDKAGPSKVGQSVAISRPIRNRTKSVKTVQNDFIYDMAKVLKLNDNSIKTSKLKKNLSKSLKD